MFAPTRLDQIIAAIRRGEIPTELQDFVRDLAHNHLAPRSWLGRLMFGPSDQRVHCHSVEVRGGIEGLRRSLIFDAGVDAPGLLERGEFPGRHSHGTFAVRPDGFHYLNRRSGEIEALFGDEPEALADTDPEHLGAFLVEVLERRLNESHDVLRTAQHLEAYQPEGGHYQLDAREWQRVRPRFVVPTRTEAPWGSRLEFCTLHGWLHHKRRLTRQIYDLELLSPEPEVHGYRERPKSAQRVRIRHTQEILSERIFAALPMLEP